MSPATKLGLNSAFWFAFGRFLSVAGAGLFALFGYIFFVTYGPMVEGQFAPVASQYVVREIQAEPSGGFSFTSRFYKGRDCAYYGITWFAADEGGNLARIQVSPLGADPAPPTTGPTGWRKSGRQVLNPPEGSTAIQAVMQHDCGFVWQTKTPIGPFKLDAAGLPIVDPTAPVGGPNVPAGQ